MRQLYFKNALDIPTFPEGYQSLTTSQLQEELADYEEEDGSLSLTLIINYLKVRQEEIELLLTSA